MALIICFNIFKEIYMKSIFYLIGKTIENYFNLSIKTYFNKQ